MSAIACRIWEMRSGFDGVKATDALQLLYGNRPAAYDYYKSMPEI